MYEVGKVSENYFKISKCDVNHRSIGNEFYKQLLLGLKTRQLKDSGAALILFLHKLPQDQPQTCSNKLDSGP